MTLEAKKLMTIITSMAILMLIPSAMAQTPGEDEFGDIGPTGITDELQEVHDIILDIMSFDTKTDPISNVLDEPMIMSLGIKEINGEQVIKIGIDEDIYDERFSEVKEGLYDRFPGIGFHLVASSGLILDTVQLDAAPVPITQTHIVNARIPDNTRSQSTTDVINISSSATIGEVSVSVNITHTYQGDLKVDLVAPNGDVIVLHNLSGGSTNNIIAIYSGGNLSILQNTNSLGDWTLRVGDYAGADIGTFNSWTLTITPLATSPTPTPIVNPDHIFEDDFSLGLSNWIRSGQLEWQRGILDENVSIPGYDRNNSVAEADDCDDEACILTLATPLDLRSYSQATLQFHRFVDLGLDSGEYLAVEVGDNGVYSEIFRWTHGDGDDHTWHLETYDLRDYLNSNSVTVRFLTEQSSSSEDVGIDNVIITTAAPTTPVIPLCVDIPRKSLPLHGGDKIIAFDMSTRQSFCGTATLGGLTSNTDQGFVISGHLLGYGNTDGYVLEEGLNPDGVTRGTSVIGDIITSPPVPSNNIIRADAAFVKYPYTCTDTYQNTCFEYEFYNTVNPLTIQGDIRIYDVTGSSNARDNQQLHLSGARSGELIGTVEDLYMTYNLMNSPYMVYGHSLMMDQLPVEGDSGAPVYAVPNNNGDTEIVGVYVGRYAENGMTYGVFSPWTFVTSSSHLDIDPIP